MFYILTLDIEVQDMLDILFHQFVLVALVYKLIGSINKQHFVIGLVLANNDDAGRNRHTEEKVCRQLDDGVYIVVIYEILANLLFCAATI